MPWLHLSGESFQDVAVREVAGGGDVELGNWHDGLPRSA
jgi:hypothetical protein